MILALFWVAALVLEMAAWWFVARGASVFCGCHPSVVSCHTASCLLALLHNTLPSYSVHLVRNQ
jgi:hypothetical protein